MTDEQVNRHALNPCPHCGYDMRAQAAAARAAEIQCPECGQITRIDNLRQCRDPSLLWHAGMGVSFGLPLVLMACEAAQQMVDRAGGAAVRAPGWLALLVFGGLLGMTWGIMLQSPFARDRSTFIARGVALVLTYLFLLLCLNGGIDWARYRV